MDIHIFLNKIKAFCYYYWDALYCLSIVLLITISSIFFNSLTVGIISVVISIFSITIVGKGIIKDIERKEK